MKCSVTGMAPILGPCWRCDGSAESGVEVEFLCQQAKEKRVEKLESEGLLEDRRRWVEESGILDSRDTDNGESASAIADVNHGQKDDTDADCLYITAVAVGTVPATNDAGIKGASETVMILTVFNAKTSRSRIQVHKVAYKAGKVRPDDTKSMLLNQPFPDGDMDVATSLAFMGNKEKDVTMSFIAVSGQSEFMLLFDTKFLLDKERKLGSKAKESKDAKGDKGKKGGGTKGGHESPSLSESGDGDHDQTHRSAVLEMQLLARVCIGRQGDYEYGEILRCSLNGAWLACISDAQSLRLWSVNELEQAVSAVRPEKYDAVFRKNYPYDTDSARTSQHAPLQIGSEHFVGYVRRSEH